ncbi:MAG: DUF3277 family protein [Defluviitaleaceae bacterium]|nr:DUF3277 family protein [Defluviitaleaceae bacterium]MCL2273440.1 DUF3277 family protein [Defluviitaleaceae bacterium]
MEHAPIRTYDPGAVNLVVGGQVITGVADGTWITVERAEDSFTEYIGSKGEVAMAESNNRSGTVTVTLENTSPSVAYLYRLAKRRGRNAIIDVSVVDANEEGGMRWAASEGRVRRPPNYEAGKEITEREFQIFVADLDFEI